VHKKYLVHTHLVLAIAGAHLLLLLPCFLLEQSAPVYHIHINKSIMDSSLPIIFLPFQEKAFVQSSAHAPATKKASAPKQAIKAVKQEAVKAKKIKAAEKVRFSQNEKKQEQKKAKPAPVVEKKIAAKPVEKIKPKKIEQKIAAQEEKQKKEIPEAKTVTAQQAKAEETKELSTAIDALYVGRADLDQLAVQHAIHNVFAAHWQPPIGLSPDLACHIKFMVNAKGEVQEIVMLESSGVLIYDIAVQNALRESSLHLPVCAYGKEFCITFTQ